MKLTPELKEIAQRVAQEMQLSPNTFAQMPAFAERFLAALPNSEPVAWQSEKNLDFVTTYPSKVKQWESSGYEVRPLYAAQQIPQDYKAQLAESQAREAKLREALSELKDLMEDICNGDYRPDSFTTQPSRIALATPFDATALNELIAKAGEVMRERAAKNTRDTMFRIGQASPYRKMVSELLDTIRALPGVTLEDLK